MDTYTVSFLGHRKLDSPILIEEQLEAIVLNLLSTKAYIEFLVGRDGDFDLLAASVIHRCKRTFRNDNSSLVWVMPYPTAEYRDNESAYRAYYDVYRLSSAYGQEILLSPDVLFRIGPYFGWRWIFLGTTIELKNLGVDNNSLKKEFTLSLYSAQIGVDLYYRRTGNDYKIRKANFGSDDVNDKLKSVPFDGLNVGITGFNVYYIFNHNRFSYPAAFSQSTCQKISCGSWMAGLGYTHHNLELDHEKLKRVVEETTNNEVQIDSSLMFNRLKYDDINVSVGYGYRTTMIMACPCAVGIFALAEPILLMLYPAQKASAIAAVPTLMIMALSVVFEWLFGFHSSELVSFPITALGAVGAALGLVPRLQEAGLIDGNAIAVFTAMGMCWSGYLSTHTAMLDSLGYRELTSKAIVSHTIGGLFAGIVAHWCWKCSDKVVW